MKNFLIIGLSLSLLMACGQAEQSTAGEAKAKNYSWSLVTTWPKNYPGLGMAPERFSKLVDEMTQGQLKVTVYLKVKIRATLQSCAVGVGASNLQADEPREVEEAPEPADEDTLFSSHSVQKLLHDAAQN